MHGPILIFFGEKYEHSLESAQKLSLMKQNIVFFLNKQTIKLTM